MFDDDGDTAAALDGARAVVGAAGAAALDSRPWQHPSQPPSDGDLVRFAVWAASLESGTDTAVVHAGLRLLACARAELDQVEAGLLFAARAAEMTWPQIAEALDLASAQAAQQRLNRVLGRVTSTGSES